MEIRELEYFLACCETGSFTAAARRAHIVQSAMSSAIARLERDLGVELFDRSVTPVAVTEHGAALRTAAQRVLETVRAARDEVHAVSGRVRGTVVLGCTLSTGPLDLAAVLTGMRARHPEVVIQLRQSSAGSAGNLRAVLDGSMDIALTAGERRPDGIVLRPLATEPLVFVCGTDHPLAGRDALTLPGLSGERILRFPPGWGMRDIVDRVLGPVQSATEVADYGLMARLVRAGFGATLMPASAVESGDGLCVVPLDAPELTRQLSAAVSARRRTTAATEALLEALTAAASGSPGPDPGRVGTGPAVSSR